MPEIVLDWRMRFVVTGAVIPLIFVPVPFRAPAGGFFLPKVDT
jgi:hypothetical protein